MIHAVGLDNVIHLPDEVRDKVREATAKGAGGVSETGHKLKVGELDFEAMMRHLDNMPIDLNAQVYAKSKRNLPEGVPRRGCAVHGLLAPNPFKSMSEREFLDYNKEIADKTGQDVKEIELIVQAKETEIKETKEERGWREDQITENYNQDYQPGTVETTTVSIVNGNDDRAPSPTPRAVRAWKAPLEGLVPLGDQEEEEVPNAINLVKKEEGQKGGELEEESLLLK
ncbi:putative gamma-adducin isoform X1 [Apostichopus japonicus]|uniref:Putative gamma-adducin isoform X1 n=1 Tax=Stichopus japonicus TaxID=307972 RepID=A0A2G8KB21_STIJA|nr:putative gamma-adducin isoform X1 [Apostichopus japonicus]